MATKVCKICGKEYEYCRSIRPGSNSFRWQDVACCPEHAAIYFARIEESRRPKAPEYIDDMVYDEEPEEYTDEEWLLE